MLWASKGPGSKIVSSVLQHLAFFKMVNMGKEKAFFYLIFSIDKF